MVRLMSVSAQSTRGRAAPWGADLPVDEEQARARILDAAEACYAERGPSNTRMTDIAKRAGVHRSTVYTYFANRDAVLAACFVRAEDEISKAEEPCWQADQPFLERLVRATLVGMKTGRQSPTMQLMIGEAEVLHMFRVAEASELWRKRLTDDFGGRIADAVAHGEVRDDVSPETMAYWVTRIVFSLIAEPGRPEDGGDEGILRTFVTASLAPRS